MFSKHSFIGRLTDDPKGKDVPSGGNTVRVVNFSAACDRDRGDGTDYYDVVTWRGLAENCEKYLSKGRLVLVSGRPQKRSYDVTRDGVTFKQYVTEIIADEVQFLDKASSDAGSSAPDRSRATVPAGTSDERPIDISDDDLPF